MLVRVLLIVHEPLLAERLQSVIEADNVVATRVASSPAFWRAPGSQNADLTLVSLAALPEPVAAAIARLRDQPDQPEVVVLSDDEDPQVRAALLAAGAMAVVNTGIANELLGETLAALIGKRREAVLGQLAGEGSEDEFRLGDFITKSPNMSKLVEVAQKVARSRSSLLILGETGVGKERLARAIHEESERREGPFIVVNCGAVPESLWESELFGHEEGAFTGASRARRGYIELAHGGTLFLDEIGEMPLNLQVKLLRVLQEREIQRLGSERALPVDVRVMAATNRDLLAEAKENRFRTDLYYRLSVVTMVIPPLRERREDIPALVENYLEHFAVEVGTTVKGIRDDALRALLHYDWPGNVRELMNVVERAVLLCSGEVTVADLPDELVGFAGGAVDDVDAATLALENAWDELPLSDARRAWLALFEKRYLEKLLQATGGRIGATAARAGIDPRSLYDKMQRHGLRKEDFKGS